MDIVQNKGGVEYQYDIENRLIKVETPRGSSGQNKTIEISLSPGWQFVSALLELSDYSIANVLSSISGKYSQVSRYNSSTGEFESFINNSKFDQFSEFTFGEGYMVYITEPCTLTITGSTPSTDKTLNLKADWNLIAAPSTEEISVSEALNNLQEDIDYDRIVRYNKTTELFENLSADDFLKPGESYYLHCLNDVTWDIPEVTAKVTTILQYDGDGSRVRKTTSSGSTTYIGSLYEEDSDGNQKCHIYLGRNKVFTSLRGAEADEAIYFYHPDHLGSSNVITDENGQEIQRLEYLPYGQVNVNTGQDVVRHKFTGKELDSSTGLYYFGARFYDASIGRFITPDSFIQDPYDPQSFGRYTYCRSDPIKYVDPSGNFWGAIFAFLGFIAKAAAVVSVVSTIVAIETGSETAAKVAKVSGLVSLGTGLTSAIGNYAIAASAAQKTTLAAADTIVLDTIRVTPGEQAYRNAILASSARKAAGAALGSAAVGAASATIASTAISASSVAAAGLEGVSSNSTTSSTSLTSVAGKTFQRYGAGYLGSLYKNLNIGKWDDLWSNARYARYGSAVRNAWSGVQGIGLFLGGQRVVEPYSRVGAALTVDQAQTISAIRMARMTLVTYGAGLGATAGYAAGGGPLSPWSPLTAGVGAVAVGGLTDVVTGWAERAILRWAGYPYK